MVGSSPSPGTPKSEDPLRGSSRDGRQCKGSEIARPLRRLAATVAPPSAPRSESSDPAVASAAFAESIGARQAARAKRAPAIIESPQATIASTLPERDRRSPASRTTREDPTTEEHTIAAADQTGGRGPARP